MGWAVLRTLPKKPPIGGSAGDRTCPQCFQRWSGADPEGWGCPPSRVVAQAMASGRCPAAARDAWSTPRDCRDGPEEPTPFSERLPCISQSTSQPSSCGTHILPSLQACGHLGGFSSRTKQENEVGGGHGSRVPGWKSLGRQTPRQLLQPSPIPAPHPTPTPCPHPIPHPRPVPTPAPRPHTAPLAGSVCGRWTAKARSPSGPLLTLQPLLSPRCKANAHHPVCRGKS